MTDKQVSWIIYTGALNHMTGNLSDLHNLRVISPCPVGLPYGINIVTTKEGSIIFYRYFVLENVLYVPGLSCNLISVSQLIDHSNCTIQFTHNMCVIQNRTSRMLIGEGERRDGLYYFKGILRSTALKVDKGISLDLWHQRLRHLSMRVTKIVSSVDLEKGNENLNNKCCDVCQRGKLTKNKFTAMILDHLMLLN